MPIFLSLWVRKTIQNFLKLKSGLYVYQIFHTAGETQKKGFEIIDTKLIGDFLEEKNFFFFLPKLPHICLTIIFVQPKPYKKAKTGKQANNRENKNLMICIDIVRSIRFYMQCNKRETRSYYSMNTI